MISIPDDSRARLEFIEAELRFVQSCLTSVDLYLDLKNAVRAKELLDAAIRSHDTALDQLAKLAKETDSKNLKVFAHFLAEDIRDRQVEIQKYLRQ